MLRLSLTGTARRGYVHGVVVELHTISSQHPEQMNLRSSISDGFQGKTKYKRLVLAAQSLEALVRLLQNFIDLRNGLGSPKQLSLHTGVLLSGFGKSMVTSQ